MKKLDIPAKLELLRRFGKRCLAVKEYLDSMPEEKFHLPLDVISEINQVVDLCDALLNGYKAVVVEVQRSKPKRFRVFEFVDAGHLAPIDDPRNNLMILHDAQQLCKEFFK